MKKSVKWGYFYFVSSYAFIVILRFAHKILSRGNRSVFALFLFEESLLVLCPFSSRAFLVDCIARIAYHSNNTRLSMVWVLSMNMHLSSETEGFLSFSLDRESSNSTRKCSETEWNGEIKWNIILVVQTWLLEFYCLPASCFIQHFRRKSVRSMDISSRTIQFPTMPVSQPYHSQPRHPASNVFAGVWRRSITMWRLTAIETTRPVFYSHRRQTWREWFPHRTVQYIFYLTPGHRLPRALVRQVLP